MDSSVSHFIDTVCCPFNNHSRHIDRVHYRRFYPWNNRSNSITFICLDNSVKPEESPVRVYENRRRTMDNFPTDIEKTCISKPHYTKVFNYCKKKNGCGCLQRQRRMQRQKEKKKTWGCSVGCFSSEIGLEFNMKKKGLIKMFCWYAFMSECVMMRGPRWPGCCFWLIFCAPDVSNIWWLWGN